MSVPKTRRATQDMKKLRTTKTARTKSIVYGGSKAEKPSHREEATDNLNATLSPQRDRRSDRLST